MANEIEDRLKVYAALLLKWQRVINLVAPSTLEELHNRHFLDSFQILDCVPSAISWVDMGSGAGFPGLVTAIRLTGVKGATVHLIESDQRKCAFLREVSRETGAPAIVHNGRIEVVMPEIRQNIQAVSARALAPLSKLIYHCEEKLLKGAVGVFPKGQDLGNELTEASRDSRFSIHLRPSQTNPGAHIAIVTATCVPAR